MDGADDRGTRQRIVIDRPDQLHVRIADEVPADPLDHHAGADDQDTLTVDLVRHPEPARTGSAQRNENQAHQGHGRKLRGVDLARPVEAVDQHAGTKGEESPHRHGMSDPAEVPERLLAEPPVALLVKPVQGESQESDEWKREIVDEVGPEALKRVRRLMRHFGQQSETCHGSDRERDEVGCDHQPVAATRAPDPWHRARLVDLGGQSGPPGEVFAPGERPRRDDAVRDIGHGAERRDVGRGLVDPADGPGRARLVVDVDDHEREILEDTGRPAIEHGRVTAEFLNPLIVLTLRSFMRRPRMSTTSMRTQRFVPPAAGPRSLRPVPLAGNGL